jgi:hypothetical protein
MEGGFFVVGGNLGCVGCISFMERTSLPTRNCITLEECTNSTKIMVFTSAMVCFIVGWYIRVGKSTSTLD